VQPINFNTYSSGFGHNLALAALARGDTVIATTRPQSLAKLDEIKGHGATLLGLDVTAPLEELHKIANEAVEIHGRIDVLVNNAGQRHSL
jgi:NAD(P)-dependent dehydrogenase (short-subunit alcohol dehydrogenase family)